MRMREMIQGAAWYLYEYCCDTEAVKEDDDNFATPSEWIASCIGCKVSDLKRCGVDTDYFDENY